MQRPPFKVCGNKPLLILYEELTLRGGTYNDLAHINIGRLLDRERNSARDRIRRDGELIRDSASWALTSGFATVSTKSAERSRAK